MCPVRNNHECRRDQPVLTKSYITSLGTFTIELYDSSIPLPEQLDYTEESYTASDGGVIKYLVTKEVMAEDNMAEDNATVTVPENFSATVYPNPFSDEATLLITNWDELQMKNAEIKIYTIIGTEIKTNVIRNSEGFILRRNALSDGMYFYQILSANETIVSSGKFVISTTH